jgi:two-component system, cell cycle response regulator
MNSTIHDSQSPSTDSSCGVPSSSPVHCGSTPTESHFQPKAEETFERMKKSARLPSPPGVAVRLLELEKSQHVSINEISRIISADPALTAKIINYANSPVFGLRRTVSSLNDAVVFIGLRSLKMVALSFSLVDTKKDTSTQFDFEDFWRRSLATAVACQSLSNTIGYRTDQAFLAGLVCEIGMIALARVVPEEWNLAVMQSETTGESIEQIEEAWLGTTHFELGARLLSSWNFPDDLCLAIGRFRKSKDHRGQLENVLILARQIAALMVSATPNGKQLEQLRSDAKQLIGMDAEQLAEVYQVICDNNHEYSRILEMSPCEIRSFRELEQDASDSLTQLTVALQQEFDVLAKSNVQLRKASETDALTGLQNRRAFEKAANKELERCKRTRSEFVMLVIDVDNFKRINDTFGHAAGDQALMQVGKCLQEGIRLYDTAFRVGGEEFVIMLPDCKADLACRVAERLRSAVELCTVSHNAKTIRVTVSIGVATTGPDVYVTSEELFDEADKRLYDAKQFGRNRCVFPPAAK